MIRLPWDADSCGRDRGGERVGAGEHGEPQARGERPHPAPLLEVERERDEERRLTGPEADLGEQPGAERPVGEQAEVEQRGSTPAREPALVDDEQRKQHRRRGERQPRPQRPAALAALDEREHERDECRRGERSPAQVERRTAAARGLRNEGRGEREREGADRHVDEEAAAPAEPSGSSAIRPPPIS
jgi:hypothetical protein